MASGQSYPSYRGKKNPKQKTNQSHKHRHRHKHKKHTYDKLHVPPTGEIASPYYNISEITCKLFTPSECINYAHQLYQECCAHYATEGPPSGSIYTGSIGSQLYLGLFLFKNDKTKLKGIQNACKSAAEYVKRNPPVRQRFTLLKSPLLGAMVLDVGASVALHEMTEAMSVANQVVAQISSLENNLHQDDCDVLYGRAGCIGCILEMRRHLGNQTFGQDLIVRLATEILRTGNRNRSRSSLRWYWHEKQYLGAAHGTVGILQTLLSLGIHDWECIGRGLDFNPMDWIHKTLNSFIQHQYNSGNLKSSVSTTNPDKLVQWCHGSPGHVLLLLQASQIFHNNEYLQQAIKLGQEIVWPRGLLKKGVGLCHGISGNALVFCALARMDPDHRPWIAKAHAYASFAWNHLDRLRHVPDRPFSLFEGLGGLAFLFHTLANEPEISQFPCYLF